MAELGGDRIRWRRAEELSGGWSQKFFRAAPETRKFLHLIRLLLTFIPCSVMVAWQGQEYQQHLCTSGSSSHQQWRFRLADPRAKHRTEGFVLVTLVIWSIQLIVSLHAIKLCSTSTVLEIVCNFMVPAQVFNLVVGLPKFPMIYMAWVSICHFLFFHYLSFP